MENAIYIDAASKLIPKYSGYTTEEGIKGGGKSKGRDPRYAGLFQYLGSGAFLGDQEKADELNKKFKGSGFSRFLNFITGPLAENSKVFETVNELRKTAGSEERLLKEVNSYIEEEVYNKMNPQGLSEKGISKVSSSLIKAVANSLITQTPKNLYNLPEEDRQGLYSMFEDNPEMLKEFNKEGEITNDIWKAYQDYSIDFYTDRVFSFPKAVPTDTETVKELTDLLFGFRSGTGSFKVTTNNDEEFEGPISDLQLIDPDSGSSVTVADLDLGKNEEVNVIYNGEASADNPYSADLHSVKIKGKEYYVDVTNARSTPTSKLVDHFLNSYKYNHNRVGMDFNTAIFDAESDQDVIATPRLERNIESDGSVSKQYIITTNIGKNYSSNTSIYEAWNKLIADLNFKLDQQL